MGTWREALNRTGYQTGRVQQSEVSLQVKRSINFLHSLGLFAFPFCAFQKF